MNFCYRLFFIFIFIISGNHLYAQNITGKWEGYMLDELIQINIEQRKDELCGFTYDYLLRNRRSFCSAKFEGYYDSQEETWFLSGSQFIQNSGGHSLMRIKLWRERGALAMY